MKGTMLCQPDVQQETQKQQDTNTHMLYEADFMHPLKITKTEV